MVVLGDKMRSYKSEGVVLLRRVYGEADRILVVYSRDFGKHSLMAKGVRRPSSRKRGHVEIFSKINFSAVKGKGMDLITEADLIDNYSMIRKSLKKATVGYYFCEVIEKVTREGEKNEELYNLLIGYLEDLVDGEELTEMRKEFVREVLISIGFWPMTKEMVDPDKVLAEVTEREMASARVGKKMLQ